MIADPKNPRIVAHLETNEQGEPVVVEKGGHRHYKVRFEVADAPSDAYAATFELHPTTYYDPVRSVFPSRDGKLQLATTTYGDYDLTVRLQTKEGELRLADSVVNALDRGMKASSLSPTAGIERALVDIKSN